MVENKREKSLKTVVTFSTMADAMQMESEAAEKGFPGRIIPVPSEISAGCGLAWRVDERERQALLNAIRIFTLPYEGIFEIEMY